MADAASKKKDKGETKIQGNNGRVTLPQPVNDAETCYLRQRRQEAGVSEDGPRVGLALSGGGIRSATFCLGVLQKLAANNVLRYVDFMSTVSGGGYIGSCLTSLMTIRKEDLKAEDDATEWAKSQFDLHERMPFLTPDQLHHLRSHGDFLVAQKGLFRRDVLRAVGSVGIGILCSLAIFICMLLLIVAGFFGFGQYFGGGLWQTIKTEHIVAAELPSLLFPTAIWPDMQWQTFSFLLGAVISLAFVAVIRRLPFSKQSAASGETSGSRLERRILWIYGLTLLFGVLAGTIVMERFREVVSDNYIPLLLPAAGFLGAFVAMLMVYIWFARTAGAKWNPTYRSLVGAMNGICLYMTITATAIVAMVLLLWWMRSVEGGFWTAGLAVVSFLLTRVFALRGGDMSQTKGRFDKINTILPGVLLSILVPVFVVAATLVCANVFLEYIGPPLWQLWLIPLVCGIFGAFILGFAVNFNNVSPHYFYRDRLADTYLVTDARRPEGLIRVRDDYPLLLKELHSCETNNSPESEPEYDEVTETPKNRAPYHLIVGSLNLPGSRDLARKDRQSDHFIFSRCYCGSSTTGYARTYEYFGGSMKLAHAVTISGAAAAGLMGFHTSFARAFALTLFNIRLGYWISNPAQYEVAMPRHLEDSGRKRPKRLGFLRFFGPYYLWHEMAALAHARSAFVNVSDGGHTGDNIGLYPLIQRRCKLIIACDAEKDPQFEFPSLTSAMRQVLTDENVGFDIELKTIRPSEPGGLPKDSVMIGQITYPVVDDQHNQLPVVDHHISAPEEDEDDNDKGYVIYLKSAFLNENEAATVKSYAARNSDFPHQSTADLFFSDDQFEAYRALGAIIANNALQRAARDEEDSESADLDVEKLIKWCKKEFKKKGAKRGDLG